TLAGATRLTVARWSPKLPTASVLNSWSLDDLPDPAGFWGAVGTATAQHLAPDDAPAWEQARLAVAAAIESYVRDAEDEASAVPIAAARERVAELRRAAGGRLRDCDWRGRDGIEGTGRRPAVPLRALRLRDPVAAAAAVLAPSARWPEHPPGRQCECGVQRGRRQGAGRP